MLTGVSESQVFQGVVAYLRSGLWANRRKPASHHPTVLCPVAEALSLWESGLTVISTISQVCNLILWLIVGLIGAAGA